MNGTAAKRAWDFVNGFDVPPLNSDQRDQWTVVIDRMSEEQFTIGVTKTRERAPEQLHLRPSIEAFRAYARSNEVKRRPQAVGCLQCEAGWVDVGTEDHGITTVRPCHHCKPDQYEAWRSGAFMPRGDGFHHLASTPEPAQI